MTLRRLASFLLTVYWKVRKPKTFGVKAAIQNPENPEEILLVLHSYGDRSEWNLPGGGYNRKREAPEDAIAREIAEELGVDCVRASILGEYFTNYQGKQDTVTIFVCEVSASEFKLSAELMRIEWANVYVLRDSKQYYRIVRRAALLLIERIETSRASRPL